MRKTKEVLRLKAAGQSNRVIARSLGIARSTVAEYLTRSRAAGVAWPLPEDWTDADLEARVFPPTKPSNLPRPLPDWAEVRREMKLRKRTGVTLQLLWLEYKQREPEGLGYSQFCERYRCWRGQLDHVLRQEHVPGDKAFIDYAGQTVPIVDRTTGEVREAQVFVAVLGASNLTYAEATWSQDLADWIGSHVHMLEYYGGVPRLLVPDNLKSGVKSACYYEPDVNPTYHEMAVHYGTAVLPTRVRKPRDKAKVEGGVLIVERWILACLRKLTFFSLTDLNREISRLLDKLNNRPFQKLEGCRRSLFEDIERQALLPLPAERYEFAQWKKARVNIDYHVDVGGHYYSVPYALTGQQVDVRITATSVEILHGSRRVAAHLRGHRKGAATCDPGHRPRSHQQLLEWKPSRIIAWAKQTGPRTAELAQSIMESRPHPEQGYRTCLGLMRLGTTFSPERLEAACDRALQIRGLSYGSVKSILQNGLDRIPLEEQPALALPQEHEHVRGSDYYATTLHGEVKC